MNKYANSTRAMSPTMMFSIKGLKFFAPVGVKLARHKKQRDDGDVNNISHRLRF